jgi:NADH:ubiquinone oxidoreductase subunit E
MDKQKPTCKCASGFGARSVLSKPILYFIDKAIEKERPESDLIAILHKVQEHYGYLPEPQMRAVSELLKVPLSRITGIATFYHLFKLQPKGRHTINVCEGTACYVKGSETLAKKLKEELGIIFGETTQDLLFTLEQTRCIGTCALAPVIKIDDEVYPQVKPDQIPGILRKYSDKKFAV